ncbi:hypothetical protein [Sorangium sp. So ce233]|uniref:hypothetical protein n=1 Tax=Sorangium sp. So ce233 TaxID=3133290 RepID=UPI003F64440A
MDLRRFLVSLALVPVALAASTQLSSARDRMPRNGLGIEAVPRNRDFLHRLRSSRAALVPTLRAILAERSPAPWFTTGDLASEDELLKYIVGCAIDADVPVQVGGLKWIGELGLCGEWLTRPATDECLEAVSGCVLARMNALERLVPISIRDQDTRLTLLDAVPVQGAFRDRTPILSLRACDPGESPRTHNCGWTEAYVGICTRGERVSLERQQPVMARVCKGIHGCDRGQEDISSPRDSPLGYAGFVEEFLDNGSIEFTCPSDVLASPSGQPDHTYFGVMVAPVDEGPVSPDAIAAPPGAPVIYPAAEQEVFTYAEGAFYGNIFMQPGYACYSETWSAGQAYLTDRLCADPAASGVNCGLTVAPYPCQSDTAPSDAVCADTSPAPESAYLDCKASPSSGHRWAHGVTVFLNDVCDLASTPELCSTARPHDRCTTGAALNEWDSPSVARVCDVDPYCCTTAWDSTCVSEVESVAGSRVCTRAGDCSHPLCTTGDRCDPEPDTASACIWELCAADPYCCTTAWDGVCVAEVESVCGQTCD